MNHVSVGRRMVTAENVYTVCCSHCPLVSKASIFKHQICNQGQFPKRKHKKYCHCVNIRTYDVFIYCFSSFFSFPQQLYLLQVFSSCGMLSSFNCRNFLGPFQYHPNGSGWESVTNQQRSNKVVAGVHRDWKSIGSGCGSIDEGVKTDLVKARCKNQRWDAQLVAMWVIFAFMLLLNVRSSDSSWDFDHNFTPCRRLQEDHADAIFRI